MPFVQERPLPPGLQASGKSNWCRSGSDLGRVMPKTRVPAGTALICARLRRIAAHRPDTARRVPRPLLRRATRARPPIDPQWTMTPRHPGHALWLHIRSTRRRQLDWRRPRSASRPAPSGTIDNLSAPDQGLVVDDRPARRRSGSASPAPSRCSASSPFRACASTCRSPTHATRRPSRAVVSFLLFSSRCSTS